MSSVDHIQYSTPPPPPTPHPNPKVWDNERVVLIPDHYIFTSDARANRNVDILRDMANKYNIKYFYDIKDRCADSIDARGVGGWPCARKG